MKLPFSIIITFLFIFSACNQPDKTKSQTVFPKRIGYVNDYDNIFSYKEEKILDSLIKNFKAQSAIEISVVSLDTSMTTLDGFNSYTLRLANAWGLINQGQKNGILIGISSGLQRVRLTNSLGIEKVLSDVETKRLLDDFMFPELRKGNYFEGTRIAIAELARILNKQKN
ncbi:TPM domain-containing protein [Pedobacter sp. P351]|uniref:TPM domain-containing protein n=1 Tax=Pedobacter superstes TaxID=3133441 RepID=UPI0030B16962